jgi:hypothetical protein
MTAEIRYYDITDGRDINVAGYALAVLEEIAAGVSVPDETPAESAQVHLNAMVAMGYITPRALS